MNDAGVNFAAGAADFLLQLLVVQLRLQGRELFVVGADFIGKGMALHRGGNGLAHGGDVKWLVEVIARAQAQGLADGLDRLVGGEHDDFGRRLDGFEPFQDFRPAHPSHANVQDGDVDLVLLGQFHGALAVGGNQQVVIVLEDDTQGLSRTFLIIDNEESPAGLCGPAGCRLRNGSRS